MHLIQYADDVVAVAKDARQPNEILEKCRIHSVKYNYRYSPSKCIAFSDGEMKLEGECLPLKDRFDYLGFPFTRHVTG